MKILTRDDTDHNTEYVTLSDYRELEQENARLKSERENWRLSSVCRSLRLENDRLQQERESLRLLLSEWLAHDLQDNRACEIISQVESFVSSKSPNHPPASSS